MSLTRQDKTLIIECLRIKQQEIHIDLSELEENDQTDTEEYQALDTQFDHISVLKHKIREL
ncbi:hypothetical protein THIOSC15_2720004 [uncultured Thiomicrorhabdus sp.]